MQKRKIMSNFLRDQVEVKGISKDEIFFDLILRTKTSYENSFNHVLFH